MPTWSIVVISLSTGVTPFMLVYSSEVVLPAEIELPISHLAIAAQLNPFHHDYAFEHMTAPQCLEEYQSDTSNCLRHYWEKMTCYYNKRTSPLSFTPKTLVLYNARKVRADLPRSKFSPSWEGPNVIFEVVGIECYDLKTVDEDDVFWINTKFLNLWHDPIVGGHAPK